MLKYLIIWGDLCFLLMKVHIRIVIANNSSVYISRSHLKLWKFWKNSSPLALKIWLRINCMNVLILVVNMMGLYIRCNLEILICLRTKVTRFEFVWWYEGLIHKLFFWRLNLHIFFATFYKISPLISEWRRGLRLKRVFHMIEIKFNYCESYQKNNNCIRVLE